MASIETAKHIDRDRFVARGERIYRQKYKKRLEKTAKGKVIAIEVESGDAFVGDSVSDAAMKALEEYPDQIFYFIRVGARAVHSLKGPVLKRVSQN
jgi:hypothetical protein